MSLLFTSHNAIGLAPLQRPYKQSHRFPGRVPVIGPDGDHRIYTGPLEGGRGYHSSGSGMEVAMHIGVLVDPPLPLCADLGLVH